jgi:predicted nucleic acid-binding protein
MSKLENGEYVGTTSTLILNEVVHKLMLAEVVKINRLSSEHEALKMIKKNPDIISRLHSTWSNYAYIRRYPITIAEVDKRAMDLSVQFAERYRLLISDAVHIAIMKSRAIINLASNDSDFEKVTEVNLWKP